MIKKEFLILLALSLILVSSFSVVSAADTNNFNDTDINSTVITNEQVNEKINLNESDIIISIDTKPGYYCDGGAITIPVDKDGYVIIDEHIFDKPQPITVSYKEKSLEDSIFRPIGSIFDSHTDGLHVYSPSNCTGNMTLDIYECSSGYEGNLIKHMIVSSTQELDRDIYKYKLYSDIVFFPENSSSEPDPGVFVGVKKGWSNFVFDINLDSIGFNPMMKEVYFDNEGSNSGFVPYLLKFTYEGDETHNPITKEMILTSSYSNTTINHKLYDKESYLNKFNDLFYKLLNKL